MRSNDRKERGRAPGIGKYGMSGSLGYKGVCVVCTHMCEYIQKQEVICCYFSGVIHLVFPL